MEYIAVFDIGTTSIKGMLINQKADSIGERSILLETHYGSNNEIEQHPMDWWNGIKKISKHWWTNLSIDPKQVSAITFSGQMEDVIPISRNDSINNAILYSDKRAGKEAVWINQVFPAIDEITGNGVSASTPAAKLLWIEKNQKNSYRDTKCFVFNAKDFIIYKLTNSLVTDPTTGATTGMMNLRTRRWDTEILESIGIDSIKLPKLCNAEENVGYLTEKASIESGFSHSTPVLCGSGDAGASTMGAAAVNKGDSYFYIGTTGWAAIIQEKMAHNAQVDGIFNLAHLPQGSNIVIAPLLNVGNVHNWAAETFADSIHEDIFEQFETQINNSVPGSNGLLFLPYLNGERCPVLDSEAKGAFWGVGPKTEKSDFVRSVIEGISFSLKQLTDLLVEDHKGTITVIGGGTKSAAWCQILAECIGRPIRVPLDSEYMPALGASSSAFINLGWAKNYNDFSQQFLKPAESKTYIPDEGNTKIYSEIYKRYLKLYPSFKKIYA